MRSFGQTATAAMIGFMTMTGLACSRDASEGASGKSPTALQAPAAVEAAWKAFSGGVLKPGSAEQETEHGLETWSAEFESAEGTLEVTALADGTLVAVEREVEPAQLPGAVRDHASRVLGANPDGVDRVRLAVYELEDRTPSGEVRERYIDPFGIVLMTRRMAAGAEHETPVALDALPPAARAAIEREAAGAVIEGVQKETEAGHGVYAASWRAADGARELKVLDDGTVVSLEIPTGPLPARVAALVMGAGKSSPEGPGTPAESTDDDEKDDPEDQVAHASGPTSVERMLLDAWETEVTVGGTVRQAIILSTGEILGDVTSESKRQDERD